MMTAFNTQFYVIRNFCLVLLGVPQQLPVLLPGGGGQVGVANGVQPSQGSHPNLEVGLVQPASAGTSITNVMVLLSTMLDE